MVWNSLFETMEILHNVFHPSSSFSSTLRTPLLMSTSTPTPTPTPPSSPDREQTDDDNHTPPSSPEVKYVCLTPKKKEREKKAPIIKSQPAKQGGGGGSTKGSKGSKGSNSSFTTCQTCLKISELKQQKQCIEEQLKQQKKINVELAEKLEKEKKYAQQLEKHIHELQRKTQLFIQASQASQTHHDILTRNLRLRLNEQQVLFNEQQVLFNKQKTLLSESEKRVFESEKRFSESEKRFSECEKKFTIKQKEHEQLQQQYMMQQKKLNITSSTITKERFNLLHDFPSNRQLSSQYLDLMQDARISLLNILVSMSQKEKQDDSLYIEQLLGNLIFACYDESFQKHQAMCNLMNHVVSELVLICTMKKLNSSSSSGSDGSLTTFLVESCQEWARIQHKALEIVSNTLLSESMIKRPETQNLLNYIQTLGGDIPESKYNLLISELLTYINGLLNLCWRMNISTPPLKFIRQTQESKFYDAHWSGHANQQQQQQQHKNINSATTTTTITTHQINKVLNNMIVMYPPLLMSFLPSIPSVSSASPDKTQTQSSSSSSLLSSQQYRVISPGLAFFG